MWKISKETKSVKLLRDNAIEIIMTAINRSFEMGISADETFVHINEIIDAYEMVGLFSSDELRSLILKLIVKVLEDNINERKKENYK